MTVIPDPDGFDNDLCHWIVNCFEPAIEYRDDAIVGPVPVCEKHTVKNFPPCAVTCDTCGFRPCRCEQIKETNKKLDEQEVSK